MHKLVSNGQRDVSVHLFFFFLTDKSRTVDDIIREVEDLRTNTDKEPRGFGLHRNPPTHKYGSDKGTDLSAHSNQISQKKLFLS